MKNIRTDLPVVILHGLHESWDREDIDDMLFEVGNMRAALEDVGHRVEAVAVKDPDIETPMRPYSNREYTVLNWVDGIPDIPRSYALVADALDSMGFAYTGADAAALALSDDKRQMKSVLREHGVSTPEYKIYERDQVNGWDLFPAIVKPAFEHCSVGITAESVVTNPQELHTQIGWVTEELQQPALVEEYIEGPEYPVWLLGNGRLEMLPLFEWDFSALSRNGRGMITFAAKFALDPSIQIGLKPAGLDQSQQSRLKRLLVRAYRVMRARDYARFDVRLRDGQFYILDVNLNADISTENSFAASIASAGYTYGQMGSRLVNLAWRRRWAD
jgi:D-alanine-D-alanine ligase